MRRDFGTTCTQKGTRVTKFLAGAHYTQAQGRSMVEMLGVLAIIGVLSVGAIAGYSKAMMKYKLNQHAVAVNMLINNVLSIKDKLQHTEELTHYGTLLYKLNLLPDGIEYIRNNLLQDKWFKGDTWIYYYNFQAPSEPFGGIGFRVPPTAQGAEICRNIAIAAKENAANLWLLETSKTYNDNNSEYIGNIYGDAYCGGNKACLRDLDLNKIGNLCNACNERACRLYVLYK